MNPNFEGELFLTWFGFKELPDQATDFIVTAPPPPLEVPSMYSIPETDRNHHTLGNHVDRRTLTFNLRKL